MVSVSREALSSVKGALMTFNSEISGMSWRAHRRAEEITLECWARVQQTANFVVQLQSESDELAWEIDKLEGLIAQDVSDLYDVKCSIPQMKGDLQQTDTQVHNLKGQLKDLYSARSQCEDGPVKDQLDEQIALLENQRDQTECRAADLRNSIRNAEEKQSELENSISRNKKAKANLETDLDALKRRCSAYQDKLERQKDAGRTLEADLNAYVDAMKRLELSSGSRAQESMGAVEACIAGIDGYMSANL